MRSRSTLLAIAGAAMVAGVLLHSGAQAAPRGWKCDFSERSSGIGPYGRSRTYFYSCYGRSLRETRARARRYCRRLFSCVTGACLPLDFTPRRTCGRD